VARQYGAADNVSRRFAKTSVAKIRESVSWPTTAVSIHEVIPKGVPVKVWFDLDGFDTDTHYVEFADRFSRQLIRFMATRYDHEIDQESDLQWMHSTKYADEPEYEPRCIRAVVKNSLHLTVPGIYVDSNEVHMRQLASEFSDFFPESHIDMQVYTANSSIRVIDSCKLTEPWRPVEAFDTLCTKEDAFITNVDTNDCIKIDVDCSSSSSISSSSSSSGDVVKIRAIMCDMCEDPDVQFTSCKPPSSPSSSVWWSVSVKGVAYCMTKGADHSTCTDVTFRVSMYHPYVIQSCFSGNCGGKEHKIMHKSGYFGDLSECDGPDPTLAETYLKECMKFVSASYDDEKQSDDGDGDEHADKKRRKMPSKAQRKEDIRDAMIEYEELLFVYHYNKFFACIVNEGTFLIGVEYVRDGRKAKRLIDRNNFNSQYADLPKIKNWVESTKRRKKQHVTFFPWDKDCIEVRHAGGVPRRVCALSPCTQENIKREALVPNTHEQDFNQWMGLRVPHADAWEYDYTMREVQPFIDHIHEIWCSGNMELTDWVLQWLCHVYTKPWVRLNSCIILQGMKGTGKGIVMDLMGQLLGEDHYWQIGNLDNLTGTYTHPKFATSVLGFVDEAYWGGDPRSANALKGIITEKRQDANVKYRAQRSFDSYVNVVCASNNDKIVQVTRDNRRYQFLKLVDGEKPRAYFDKLAKVKPIAIASYFLHSVCLCGFDPRNIITTNGARGQLIESFDNIEAWWYDCLCGDSDDYFRGDKVSILRLKNDMIAYNQANRVRFINPYTNHTFMLKFRKMCKPSVSRQKIYVDCSTMVNAVTLHGLNKCREMFDAYCNRSMDFSLAGEDEDGYETELLLDDEEDDIEI